MRRIQSLLIIIMVLAVFPLNVALSEEAATELKETVTQVQQPEEELQKVIRKIDEIDVQMVEASKAKDREKYNELNTERERLTARAEELKLQIQQIAGEARKMALAQQEYNKGNTQLSTGNYGKAIEHYQKSLELNPDNASAHFNIGYAYLKQRKNGEAKKCFVKTVEINPGYINAYVPLGQLESNNAKSIEYYNKAIELDPGQEKAHYGIGAIYLRQEKFNSAAAAFKNAVEADPEYLQAWVGLGRSLAGANKDSQAVEALKKATTFNPRRKKGKGQVAAAWFHLAEIYNKESQKQYSNALNAATESLKLEKYYRNSAGAHFEKGFALMNLGRKQEAKQSFEKAKSDRSWLSRAQHFIDKIDGKIQ